MNKRLRVFCCPNKSKLDCCNPTVTDGNNRLLVVEYKGAAYVSNDDSKEKRQLGELWRSNDGSEEGGKKHLNSHFVNVLL
jgi:hypothetical protein